MWRNYKIYTDGACPGNGSSDAIGGWAYIVLHEDMIDPPCVNSGYELSTTNQRMELLAAIKACDYMADFLRRERLDTEYKVTLHSDSAYLINCYVQGWWKNWLSNNWINSKREPVANQDLWKQLIPYFADPNFSFVKVNGHSGDHYNEAMDKLCREAVVLAKQEI